MAGLGRRSHYRKHLTDAVLHDLPEPDPAEGERIGKVVGTRGSNQFEVLLARVVVPPQPQQSSRSTGSGREDSDRGSGSSSSSGGGGGGGRVPQLAILPTKFRKLVWVKRNDYVIVRCGEEEEEGEEEKTGGDATATSGIRYEIVHILYKDQVKHLKTKGLWPDGDAAFADDGNNMGSDEQQDLLAAGEEQAAVVRDRQDEGGGYDSQIEAAGHDGGGAAPPADDDGIVYDNSAYDDNDDDLLFVNTNRMASLRVQDSDTESSSDSD